MMVEGRKHLQAKTRAIKILSALGCDWFSVEEPINGATFDLEKTFYLDCYGELKIKIGIEIDGHVNHGTRITIAKDKWRDRDNLERNKTYTVRFHPDEVIGKHALSDIEMMNEIRWSLKRQGLMVI